MAERKSPPQNPHANSETSEPLSINPTPLEAAFGAEIQSRFNTALLEPFVDEHGRLVRLTTPVVINNSLVAFQYTRYNPVAHYSKETKNMLLAHNPTIGKEIPGIKSGRGRRQKSEWDEIEDELDMEEGIVEAFQKRIIARDGALDPLKALTDPAYCTEGAPIKRWPESFEVVIFENFEQSTIPQEPAQIGNHGMLNEVRADVWIHLSVPMDYEGNYNNEGQLHIRHSRREYETLMAFANTFDEYHDPEEFKEEGLQIDDIDWFPLSKPWEHSIFPTHYPPEKTMGTSENLSVN